MVNIVISSEPKRQPSLGSLFEPLFYSNVEELMPTSQTFGKWNVVTMNNLKGNQPANSSIARHSGTVSLWRHVSGVSATRVTPGDWRKGVLPGS